MKFAHANYPEVSTDLSSFIDQALEETGGLLRLAPNWVPRSFMIPGRRLKLHPDDLYAFGLDRGGINERWFSSTTEAANEGRLPDEGLSYLVAAGKRLTLRDAIAERGADLIGEQLWQTYQRWPVYSKFFDNWGPIPHHLHQSHQQAALVGREGKPELYYFPPQHNRTLNAFPYTFMGLEPGTSPEDVRRCLENWNRGDNGILDLSRAYRLEPGTGWKIDPCLLHAPGSLCTYEPQWASDVFAMYQNLVDGRSIPWSLLVKDMPSGKHQDLDFILQQIDWEKNTDPAFKENHFLSPVLDPETSGEDWTDKWVCYGEFDGLQISTAKELTIAPRTRCRIRDNGAYGLILIQGQGTMNGVEVSSPTMIRFNEMTRDEIFCPCPTARQGVLFENTSDTENFVALRYFGPGVNPQAPKL
jgi:hypothetical protein